MGHRSSHRFAVGEDAHANPALRRRLGQVVVKLPDVLWIGVDASRGPDPAFELDEGVEGGKVYGAARTFCRRVLLNDLIGPDEARGG